MLANKKTNILLFTRPLAPPWDEASKNLAFDIATHAKGNYDFHILTTNEYSEHLNRNMETADNLIPEPIFSTTSFGIWEKILLMKRLYRINIKTQIIHFLFTPRNTTSSLIKLRLRFSNIKTIQTIATLTPSAFQNLKKLHNILFANRIIAQSHFTRKKLENVGIKNISTIYPGINLAKFQPAPKDQNLLKKLGINLSDFVILYAGEYVRLKAIDDIIDALGILLANNSNFKLICACRIKSPEDKIKKLQIVEKARKLGYDKHIVFLETFSEMPSLYNISDLNIFPVREMAGKFDIPLAVVEAMACKKPVLISDIPVLEEFVKQGKTGLVVPKANPKKLAHSILDAYSNNKFRNDIAVNGYAYAMQNFNIYNTASQYSLLYDSLIQNS